MMSRGLGCRPSQVFVIQDPLVAYCLDSAVVRWGNAFEAALSDCTKNAKDQKAAERAQERTARRWLNVR